MSNDFDEYDLPPQNSPPAPRHRGGPIDLGSPDDAMMSGTPAAKFEHPGDTVKGAILSCVMSQQRDYMTGKPAFWDDGNPKTQILIVLQTEDRSDEIDDDNGARQLYVKRPSAMLKTIVTALGKTKFSESIGGTLAVKFTALGKAEKGMSPPKQYAAKFWPKGVAVSATPPAAAQPVNAGAQVASHEMKRAWSEFNKLHVGETADVLGTLWKATVAEWFPGKSKNDIRADEWRKMVTAGFEMPTPVFDEPAMAGGAGIPPDDIPFSPMFDRTFI